VNKERLLKLADFLERVDPSNFNWNFWASKQCVAKAAAHGDPQRPRCGTTACALGWAGMMPEFQALGLVTDPKSDDVSLNGVFGAGRAAETFFGLDNYQTSAIFGGAFGGSEPSRNPKYVACKIRKMVKEYEAQTTPTEAA
jgi:hypothetical protein